ncbi:hypothetical protein FRC07_000871 [Ceratobasidium sp. 392]|nr:hypothetical protein FRC07_000871 [Ceratobasidium sp. 392]
MHRVEYNTTSVSPGLPSSVHDAQVTPRHTRDSTEQLSSGTPSSPNSSISTSVGSGGVPLTGINEYQSSNAPQITYYAASQPSSMFKLRPVTSIATLLRDDHAKLGPDSDDTSSHSGTGSPTNKATAEHQARDDHPYVSYQCLQPYEHAQLVQTEWGRPNNHVVANKETMQEETE